MGISGNFDLKTQADVSEGCVGPGVILGENSWFWGSVLELEATDIMVVL